MKRPAEPPHLADRSAAWTADYVTKKSADSGYRFRWPELTHFRPKGPPTFRHLAFAWENLFPACNSCQKEKGEDFDERLLKPDEALYDFDRYFIVSVRDGKLEPNPASDPSDQARAQVTIDILGLNAPPLRTSRRWWFENHYKDVIAFSHRELEALPYRYLASFTEC